MNVKEFDERAHKKRCDDCASPGDCNYGAGCTARKQKQRNTENNAHKVCDYAHILELALMPCVHDNQRNRVIG